jgi:twinkle protein
MNWAEIGIIVPLQGGRSASTCPKCSPHRKKEHQRAKCLTVNDELGNRWWNCNHCGYSGNLDKMERFSKVYQYAKVPTSASAISIPAREYFAKRGITTEALRLNLIYEKGKLIAFPHVDYGTVQDVRFLNTEAHSDPNIPKWTSVPRTEGSVQTAFGMTSINYNENGTIEALCIVEGHVDALTYHSSGYKNVISVPDGAPSMNAKNLETKFDWLKSDNVQKAIKAAKRIYIMPDNDAAGENFRELLADRIGCKEKTYFVKWPVGYKDHNEIFAGDPKKGLKSMGADGLASLLDTGYLYPLYGIIRLESVIERVMNPDKLLSPGYAIGESLIDNFVTLKEKHLWMITGVSGLGKSTWLRWYITQQSKVNGLKFAMYTPENRPAEREYIKILQCYLGRDLRPDDSEAILHVNNHFININPTPQWFEGFRGKVTSDTVNTLQSILSYVEALKHNDGVSAYVIDAWNKLEFQIERNETETRYVSRMLDYILNFNEKHNLACFMIAHPSKDTKDKDGNYYKPSLMSISGSANFKNKTDIGIIIHRKVYENGVYNHYAPTEVEFEKIKFEELSVNRPTDRSSSFMIMDNFGRFSKNFQTAKQDTPPPIHQERYEREIDNDNDMPF